MICDSFENFRQVSSFVQVLLCAVAILVIFLPQVSSCTSSRLCVAILVILFLVFGRVYHRYRLVPVLLCAVAILVVWYPVRFRGFPVSVF